MVFKDGNYVLSYTLLKKNLKVKRKQSPPLQIPVPLRELMLTAVLNKLLAALNANWGFRLSS